MKILKEDNKIFDKKADKNYNPVLNLNEWGYDATATLNLAFSDADLDKPLAMKLFDAGHPSWFIYLRGQKYSLENATYNDDSEQFWNFTWEQYGTKDVKAAVQYIA